MRTRTRVIGGGYYFLSYQKGGKALNSLSPLTSVKGGQRRKREVISRG